MRSLMSPQTQQTQQIKSTLRSTVGNNPGALIHNQSMRLNEIGIKQTITVKAKKLSMGKQDEISVDLSKEEQI